MEGFPSLYTPPFDMVSDMWIGKRVKVVKSEKSWAIGKEGTVVNVITTDDPVNFDRRIRAVVKMDDMNPNKPPYGKVTFDLYELEEIVEKTKSTDDPVNHPSHYTDGKYEVIDYIEKCGYYNSFHIGNAVKYISRAGKKNPEKKKEDLEKAIWYLERKLDFDKGKTILDHREEIDTKKYIIDKGLDGTAQGMALALLHENRIDLAIQALRLEVNGRV